MHIKISLITNFNRWENVDRVSAQDKCDTLHLYIAETKKYCHTLFVFWAITRLLTCATLDYTQLKLMVMWISILVVHKIEKYSIGGTLKIEYLQ